MALTDITIDFDLAQALGSDFDPRRTKAYVVFNVDNNTLMDTSTGETRLGDEAVTIASDGTGSFTTWATGAGGNPTSWQTSLVVDYPRTGQRDRKRRTFGPWTLTTADDGKNIVELEDEQAIPAEYQTAFTASMESIRDDAEAARDAAVDISNIDTSDAVVEALVKNTGGAGPLTSGALSATIASEVPAASTTTAGRVELATTAEVVTGTDAVRAVTPAAAAAHFQVKSSPLVVTPEQFGAVGDGVTNDTAAVQAAIDAVAANGGGTVLFGVGANYGKVYLCDSAPRTDRRGHSIIALPATGTGTITLSGFGKASTGAWSWIKTTRTTDTYSATYGPPSVVGGPTTENTTGTTLDRFSLWNIVIDGLGLGLPANPKLAGYDLRKMITAKADKFSVFTETSGGSYVQPTAVYAFGIGWPSSLNSGNMPGNEVQVFGMYAGVILSSPHADIRSLLTKHCYLGVGLSDDVSATTGDAHASRIGYWQSENLTYHLAGWNVTTGVQSNGAATVTRLLIDLWDIEDAPSGWYQTTSHLLDANNTIYGRANLSRTLGGVGPTTSELTASGGGNFDREYLGGSPWKSYTPTVGGTGWALGNGTVVGRWTKIGKTVHFVVQITFGTTSTYGGDGLTISLPSTRASFSAVQTVPARMVDSSAGKVYTGTGDIGNGVSTAIIRYLASATNGEAPSVVSTTPFTWASGDQIAISGTYQTA